MSSTSSYVLNTQKMFCVIVIHGRVLLFIRKNKMEYNQRSVYVAHLKFIISNGYCFHLCLHKLLTSNRAFLNFCCLLKSVYRFSFASWFKVMSLTLQSYKRLYWSNEILQSQVKLLSYTNFWSFRGIRTDYLRWYFDMISSWISRCFDY